MNIYEIFKNLKTRVEHCKPSRYIVVFVDQTRNRFFFETCNSYCNLVYENFSKYNIFVAFRKSGKLIQVSLIEKEKEGS